MEYVNLIDYLEKPELIQHVDGTPVLALFHFANQSDDGKILVVFEDGTSSYYYEDGRTLKHGVTRFILKPKPKNKVEGWRKASRNPQDGTILIPWVCKPTKEEFEDYIECAWEGFELIGEWEHVVYEIDDEGGEDRGQKTPST